MMRARVATFILVIGALIVPSASAGLVDQRVHIWSETARSEVDLCGQDDLASVPHVVGIQREPGEFSVQEDLSVAVRFHDVPEALTVLSSESTFELDSQVQDPHVSYSNLSLVMTDGDASGPCRTATVDVLNVPSVPQLATFSAAGDAAQLTVHYNAGS